MAEVTRRGRGKPGSPGLVRTEKPTAQRGPQNGFVSVFLWVTRSREPDRKTREDWQPRLTAERAEDVERGGTSLGIA